MQRKRYAAPIRILFDAPEINDGLDSQYPGAHGYGTVDEISGNERTLTCPWRSC